MDVLSDDGVGDCVGVSSGIDALVVEVCKELEVVTVVVVVVGDVLGWGRDDAVVDWGNELEVVLVVNVNGVEHVGLVGESITSRGNEVDADTGLVSTLEMDADASWFDLEEFVS